ncbi:DUF192 domain-containing protein [Methylocystis sp. WRRC1]|uniref:DUF192 domain-containing protein n=1 Tax=Methylocystis sp. WRRC1 TaxID=1732014 RepID=UPI001D1383C8|nr:DUF192 domain-containing protein [Methylocystis sp. WRRC1]MCC3243967.1 DUF192 domain-containing protein [Methylocystis sp. WRRC1]
MLLQTPVKASRSTPPLLVLLFRILSVAFALSLSVSARAEGALEHIQIVTASGAHDFKVEVARTSTERARGLMFRRSMPQDQGMLFDFKIEEPVAMWMKNTYIPLDMIFVSRKGVVTGVATDAEPLSERVIPSGPPAYAVIELNAGVARKIGVAPGDVVKHSTFR